MTPEELRTLTLFNSVENTPEINQRQLAMELGISLGLVKSVLWIDVINLLAISITEYSKLVPILYISPQNHSSN